MNYIFKSVALLSMGVLLAQCGKDEPEVVQFKDGYTVKKPQAGKRDKAPDVNLLDQYGSFTSKEVNAEAELNVQNNVVAISKKPIISVGVQTAFPVSANVTFKLSYDAEKGASSGKTIIPEDVLEIPATAVIPAKAQEVKVAIQLKEDALKKLKVGTYSFYLKLSTEDASIQFKGDDRKELLVNVKVEQSESPIVGTPFRDGFEFSSYYAADHLWKLSDMKGDKPNVGQDSNWWVDTQLIGNLGDLWTTFSTEQTIKGVVITAVNTRQMLKSMVVKYTQEDGGNQIELNNVKFIVDTKKLKTFVKFAEPVRVKDLIFSGYVGVGNPRYIDMADIEFYK
jgi:hypothetical protein